MVESVAQGAAPFLVPVRPAARGASAVAVPASDTVGATPGTAFAVEVLQEDFVLRREFLEIPAVVDRHHVVLGGVAVVEPGRAHVAERFVVPVAFTVSTDAHQLRVFAVSVPGVADASAEGVCVAEQVFEPHSRRKPGIVEKHIEVAVTDKVAILVTRENAVGARGIDIGIGASLPFAVAELAETVGLRRREDGELDAGLDEFHDGVQVDGCFGKPHGLGHATEMELEIFNAPVDLRALVLLACKRHDDMVVHLGDGVAVAVQAFAAALVRFLDSLVCFRGVRADPTHQGRTHVETHEVVVVDNIDNVPVLAQNAACGVRAITFTCNAVVPVVEGPCARLILNDARPGVLPGRLVKMPVDRKIKGVLVAHISNI